MRKVLVICLVTLLVFLTACGGVDPSQMQNTDEQRPGVVATNVVLGSEPVTTETPVTAAPTETIEPVSTEPVTTEAPETTEPEPPMVVGYRYQNFVLDRAGDSNAVFSGESFLMAVSMWRELIDMPEREALRKYVYRDYLGFDATDTLVFLNRLWADKSVQISVGGDSRLSDMVEYVNMTDPSCTTRKNSWVAQATAGYISYTPSVYTSDTKLDLMSVACLSDMWMSGTKTYDTKSRIFYNADGSEIKTVMMRDESLTYWVLDNAVAYCMYFNGGNYMMVVLPNKGVALSDVNVMDLMNGTVSSCKAHVKFYMPEFYTESSYVLRLSDFGLNAGRVTSDLVSGLTEDFVPTISHIAKVVISRYGVGNVGDERTATFGGEYDDDIDVINIICDRPFMYYIGDVENADIAFFGVVNKISEDMVVFPSDDAAFVPEDNEDADSGEEELGAEEAPDANGELEDGEIIEDEAVPGGESDAD